MAKKDVKAMKKIKNLLLTLMLLTSIMSFALAVEADDPPQEDPEDETADPETLHQIQVMNDSLGARIRLLQLEKAILINILKGNMTVQILKGLDVNTTELEVILEDLQDVLDEVQTADPAANDSVQVFVQLKNESRTLTKQFRETLRVLLDAETIAMIQEQLRNINSGELQNYHMRIRNCVRQFNRNQLYRLFGFVGEVNTTLLDEYLNGTITLHQAKGNFYKLMNQMTKQKRYMIFAEIKGENIQSRIQAQEAMENIGPNDKGKGHGGRP